MSTLPHSLRLFIISVATLIVTTLVIICSVYTYRDVQVFYCIGVENELMDGLAYDYRIAIDIDGRVFTYLSDRALYTILSSPEDVIRFKELTVPTDFSVFVYRVSDEGIEFMKSYYQEYFRVDIDELLRDENPGTYLINVTHSSFEELDSTRKVTEREVFSVLVIKSKNSYSFIPLDKEYHIYVNGLTQRFYDFKHKFKVLLINPVFTYIKASAWYIYPVVLGLSAYLLISVKSSLRRSVKALVLVLMIISIFIYVNTFISGEVNGFAEYSTRHISGEVVHEAKQVVYGIIKHVEVNLSNDVVRLRFADMLSQEELEALKLLTKLRGNDTIAFRVLTINPHVEVHANLEGFKEGVLRITKLSRLSDIVIELRRLSPKYVGLGIKRPLVKSVDLYLAVGIPKTEYVWIKML